MDTIAKILADTKPLSPQESERIRQDMTNLFEQAQQSAEKIVRNLTVASKKEDSPAGE